MIGRWIEPVLAPVGFNWQISVALIPGMAAREVAVASLGTVYAIEGGKEAAEQIGQMLATKWSLATALSLLAWYIFAPQCASTLAVIKRETGSWTLDVRHLRLHAGAGLCRGLHHVSDRGGARRGLSMIPKSGNRFSDKIMLKERVTPPAVRFPSPACPMPRTGPARSR